MKASSHHSAIFTAILLGSCLGAAAVNTRAAEALPTYEAVYDAFYQGRRVGTSQFSVVPVEDSANTYEFRTVSRLAGLYRLLAPGPVEEVSVFVYENGRIRPVNYSLSSGRRGGRDDFRIDFDWERGIATTTAADVAVQTELVPGVLDRGALQVTLMLRGDSGPDDYTLLDKDGPELHEVRSDAEETIETPSGVFSTRKLIQQRVNSSRRTLIWAAPDLDGLPVRIERQSRGESRAAFHLRSVRWLD